MSGYPTPTQIAEDYLRITGRDPQAWKVMSLTGDE